MAFTTFYIETEGLITSAQIRDTEIQNLYDIIIANIEASTLSDSKGTKTWITESYQTGKTVANRDKEKYYLAIVSFVEELQLLVLDRYDSVDEFYEEEGIVVSQVFADISEDAGYPISPQYIEDIS